jgi:hypothetical protein
MVYLQFWNQHEIPDFFNTHYDLFQVKDFTSQKSHFFKLFDTKSQIRKKLFKIEKNTFSKIILEIFSQSKIPEALF